MKRILLGWLTFLILFLDSAIPHSVMAVSSGLPAGKVAAELTDSLQAAGGTKLPFLVKLAVQTDTSQVAARRTLASAGADRTELKSLVRTSVVQALQEDAALSQVRVKELLERLMSAGHVSAYQPYWVVNAISVTGDAEAVRLLAALAEVSSLSPDTRVPLAREPFEAVLSYIGSNLDQVQAPAVWSAGSDGTGVVVASLDSGVDWTHPALKSSFRGYNPANPAVPEVNGNWLDVVSGLPTPYDDDGHGTHTTGTMVGYDRISDIKIGVAPGARWIAVKAFDLEGAYTSWLLSAGQWLLAPTDAAGTPHPEWAPDIINNSWGGEPGLDEFFRPMVQAWRAAGILPVFAAGNKGPGIGSITAPGNYPESLAVASVDINNQLANTSGRGPGPYADVPKPDLSAPGVSILSSVPGAAYARGSGTSMAAPHVAGTAALLLGKYPALTVADLEDLLRESARPLTDYAYPQSPNTGYGTGLLQAAAAHSAGLLSGTVTSAQSGGPLAVTVEVTPGGFGKKSSATTGEYRFALQPGTYTVVVDTYGFKRFEAQVTIAGGQRTVLPISLQPIPFGFVEGIVTDGATGLLLEGVTVSVVNDTHVRPVVTRLDGRFRLEALEGPATLDFRKPGYRALSHQVTVQGGTVVRYDAALVKPALGPGDWGQYLGGPDHTRYSNTLLPPPLERKWTASVAGPTIVADGVVYITQTVYPAGLYAYDLQSGKLLWSQSEFYPGTMPAFLSGKIVSTNGNGTVFAFDAATGKMMWSVSVGLGSWEPVVVADNRVFVIDNDSSLYALDDQGRLLWGRNPGLSWLTTPAVGGGSVYLTGSSHLVVIDAALGVEKWRWAYPNGPATSAVSPVLAGNSVLVLARSTLYALERTTGQVQWSMPDVSNPPAVFRDTVFVPLSSGRLAQLRLADGALLRYYSYPTLTPMKAPLIADGLLLASNGPGSSAVAYSISTGDRVWASPDPGEFLVAGGGAVLAKDYGTTRVYGPVTPPTAVTLTGNVRDQNTGAPVAGAMLSLAETARFSQTAADGSFSVYAGSGSYTLVTRAHGYKTAQQPVTLEANTALDLTLQRAAQGTISGVVTDTATGHPISSARLFVLDDASVPAAVTGADGTYQIQAYGGTYRVRVSAPNYPTTDRTLTVPDGASATINIGLEPFQSRPDDWLTPFGSPVAGAHSESHAPPPYEVIWQSTGKRLYPDRVVVANGRLFALDQDRNLQAFDLETGSLLWTSLTSSATYIPPATASYDQNKLFVARGCLAAAIDPATGRDLWSVSSICGPASQLAAGGTVYAVGRVEPGWTQVRALNEETGARLWSLEYHHTNESAPLFRPVIGDGVLYVAGDRHVAAIDPVAGKLLWTQETCCSIQSTPVLTETRILLYGTGLTAVDRKTGLVAWTRSDVSSMPVVSDGRIYAQVQGQVVSIDPQEGRDTGSYPGLTAPLAASGRLLYGRDLTVTDLVSGERFGPLLTGTSGIALAEGRVVTVGVDGTLSVLRPVEPPQTGILRGTVKDQASGRPLGAKVSIGGRSVRSDAQTGAFVLGLPAGAYDLEVTAPDMVTERRQVTLLPAEDLALQLLLNPEPQVSVNFTVRHGQTNHPVAGANIAVGKAGFTHVLTDAQGAASLMLVPGRYRVRIDAAGFEPVWLGFTVTAGTPVDLPVALGPGPAGDCPSPGCTPGGERNAAPLKQAPLQPAWSTTVTNVLGPAWRSRPAVAKGLVYTIDAGQTLYALDLTTGAVVWQHYLERQYYGMYHGPVVGGGMVYVQDDTGKTKGIDAKTGLLRWTLQRSVNTSAHSPLLYDQGRLYVGGGTGLAIVDAATGTPIAHLATASSTLAVAAEGRQVYVATCKGVAAVDTNGLQTLWTRELATTCDWFGNEVMVSGNLVLFYNSASRKLTALARTDGTQVWQVTAESAPAVRGTTGYLYRGGKIVAFDVLTGAIIWEEIMTATGAGQAPLLMGDYLVVGSATLVDLRTHKAVSTLTADPRANVTAADGFLLLNRPDGTLVAHRGDTRTLVDARLEGRADHAGTTIRLVGPEGMVEAVTGADGLVDFGYLPPGLYLMEVFHPLHLLWAQRITIGDAGAVLRVDLIPGDVNDDGVIGTGDLLAWTGQGGLDLNGDGLTDLRDLWIIAHNVGRH